jgi:hypothetical protein
VDDISGGCKRLAGDIVITGAVEWKIGEVPVAIMLISQAPKEILGVGIGVNSGRPEAIFVFDSVSPGSNAGK